MDKIRLYRELNSKSIDNFVFSTVYNVFSRNRDQEKLLAELINIEKIN